MPRKPNDLTAREVAALKEPGTHRVSANLYLQVTASVAADGDPGSVVRSWLYRYKAGDKRPEMGLGSYPEISLAEARRHVAEHQNQRRDGVDPRAAKAAQQQAAQVERAKATTFEQAAQAYIRSHRAGWKSPKSLAAWEGTLRDYAYPVIGKLPVGAVDTTLVLRVVEPIWNDKPETANRLRGRLEMVLDYARVIGQRSGENPARWRGHLDHLLPARQAVAKTVHHPALPYNELAGFMVELRQQEGVAARALEFAILTVARTGEVLGAPWAEIDLDGRIWTIPGSRMKAGRERRVSLSEPALAIVEKMAAIRMGTFVFPGQQGDRPLSNMSMLMLLRRMNRGDLTAHGFRSTFSDWCAEQTNFPSEVREMALAHVVGDKVEAAYRRGDLFEKRQQLMDAWARYANGGSSVVSLERVRHVG